MPKVSEIFRRQLPESRASQRTAARLDDQNVTVMRDMLAIACTYIRSGWAPVPVPFGRKDRC